MIFQPDELTSRMLCANITIIPDSVIENAEFFLVVLNSSDLGVLLTQSIATVNISDSSSKYLKSWLHLMVHVATLITHAL